MIITRSGIDKIQAVAKIQITYEVIRCEPNFAVFKAIAHKGAATIETFGSALKGATTKTVQLIAGTLLKWQRNEQ